MAFGQLTHRVSLSDTMLCLKANAGKLYHLAIGCPVAISTIARANETLSYKFYETLAWQLISESKDRFLNDKETMSGYMGVFLQKMQRQLTSV